MLQLLTIQHFFDFLFLRPDYLIFVVVGLKAGTRVELQKNSYIISSAYPFSMVLIDISYSCFEKRESEDMKAGDCGKLESTFELLKLGTLRILCVFFVISPRGYDYTKRDVYVFENQAHKYAN